MLRPIMSETSKTVKIILVIYWAMDLIAYDSYYIQGPNIALK